MLKASFLVFVGLRVKRKWEKVALPLPPLSPPMILSHWSHTSKYLLVLTWYVIPYSVDAHQKQHYWSQSHIKSIIPLWDGSQLKGQCITIQALVNIIYHYNILVHSAMQRLIRHGVSFSAKETMSVQNGNGYKCLLDLQDYFKYIRRVQLENRL